MPQSIVGSGRLASLVLASVLVFAACAPAAAPQQPAPAAQPGKPAAQAEKPAAQPAKPAAAPAKPAAQAIELRLAAGNPKGDILSNAVDKFAELVEQKTKGAVVVSVAYQSLGVEHQATQAVMAGSVDITHISDGNSARFTDAELIYGLPFLFKTYDNMLQSLDGPIGRKAIEQFEKDLGVKWLFPLAQGFRNIQTRDKQLRTPADIKGLKIRVVSTPIDLATFKAWGANPTPVDWSQVFPGLQQGVVDGLAIPVAIALGSKFYDVVKHNSRVGYQSVWANVFINGKKFESLSPEHQRAMLEAAKEAKAYSAKIAVELEEKALQELGTKYGMTLYTPTPGELAQWTAIREKVWQEVVAEQVKGKIDLNVAKQLYESQR